MGVQTGRGDLGREEQSRREEKLAQRLWAKGNNPVGGLVRNRGLEGAREQAHGPRRRHREKTKRGVGLLGKELCMRSDAQHDEGKHERESKA